MAKYEYVSLQFHPRAFSAFGRDLVTIDTVAVAELVKNCYDAYAYHVTVKITSEMIEITDDGLGMTEDTIRNSWAVVATPNMENSVGVASCKDCEKEQYVY